MGKTVVAMPNHPKAFFDWGRLVWVSQDDVSYDACVCISLRTCGSVGLLVHTCIWCLGQSGSFLIVYVHASESHVPLCLCICLWAALCDCVGPLCGCAFLGGSA